MDLSQVDAYLRLASQVLSIVITIGVIYGFLKFRQMEVENQNFRKTAESYAGLCEALEKENLLLKRENLKLEVEQKELEDFFDSL
jgi:hypothetical protein